MKIERHLLNFMLRRMDKEYFKYLLELYKSLEIEAINRTESISKVASFKLMFLQKTIEITRYRDNDNPFSNAMNDDPLSQIKLESICGLNLANNFYDIFMGSKTSENMYRLMKSL